MKNHLLRAGFLTLAASFPFALFGEVLLNESFSSPDALKHWENRTIGKIADGALEVTVPDNLPKNASYGVLYPIASGKIAGKRVTISADLKRDLQIPFQKWQGGKFMLTYQTGKTTEYPSVYIAPGKFDWKKHSLTVDIPADVSNARLMIGVQAGRGTIWCRHLKIETGDSILDLTKSMNMGFADKAAGDGKGGWSDQGPDNDASKFKFKGRKTFAGIPFLVVDPGRNGGRSVLSFKSAKFPGGIAEASTDLSKTETVGKYLYLLHTLTHGQDKLNPVGTIEVVGENGKKQTIKVLDGCDVANWWMPKGRKNAIPAAYWQNTSGGQVGLYASKFSLDPALGKIRSISFKAAEKAIPVWIVVGATISDNNYKTEEKKKFVQKADAVWKVLPTPARGGVIEGSALDLSFLNEPVPVGAHGRVIINKDGKYAFEKQPGKPIRFFSTAEGTSTFWNMWKQKSQLGTKADIQAFAKQLRLQGYNMVRLHFLDAVLMSKAKNNLEFNPTMQDQLDYLVYELKKNGVYINWDVMSSRIGYESGDPWGPEYNKYIREHDKRNFKTQIYYDNRVRENWYRGAEKILNHVNPYTKTRWKDDPVLAIAIGFNEQEFAFTMAKNFDAFLPLWKAFLQKKYKTPEALNKAWGNPGITSFEAVKPFTAVEYQSATPKGRDAAEFATQQETNLGNWYRDSLRKLGFKGPVTNYNMGKSFRDLIVRKNFDYIAMNSYHAHPSAFWQPGSVINQGSSINDAGNVIRGFLSMVQSGKPFHITEHGHVFWNRYRYEQSFITGAYSAFQDIDGLTGFGSQVSTQPYSLIMPFLIKHDPVAKAQEFLTALMFLRRDVSPAKNKVRMQIFSDEILHSNASFDGPHSGQTRMLLTTGYRVDCDSKVKPSENEVLVGRSGGSKLKLHGWYTNVMESSERVFDPDTMFASLKEKKLLPANNRSSFAKEIYESSTGELFMDCNKNFMSVNTPRLQGICGEAGTTAALRDFEVKKMSVRGNLALTSVDGMKPVSEASRLVLVIATNALNSDMEFEDDQRSVILKTGKAPVLLETGKFTVSFRNKNASGMKAYALGLDGKRIAELPLKKSGERIEFSVDTAAVPNGPSLYFEFTNGK